MGEVSENSLKTYKKICDWMDENNLHYQKEEEDLIVRYTMCGDDIPMDFIVAVKPEADVIVMYSPLSINIPEDKRLEVAVAVAIANDSRLIGSFDYNVAKGSIVFKMANCYMGCEFSTDILGVMITVGTHMVDDFNDKFLMVSKGMMGLDQFAEFAQN